MKKPSSWAAGCSHPRVPFLIKGTRVDTRAQWKAGSLFHQSRTHVKPVLSVAGFTLGSSSTGPHFQCWWRKPLRDGTTTTPTGPQEPVGPPNHQAGQALSHWPHQAWESTGVTQLMTKEGQKMLCSFLQSCPKPFNPLFLACLTDEDFSLRCDTVFILLMEPAFANSYHLWNGIYLNLTFIIHLPPTVNFPCPFLSTLLPLFLVFKS